MSPRSLKRQRGFNLIELMIGMVIALFGLLAVGQVMSNFAKQRASVTQTLYAQNDGVMALYLLEKDVSQAGYGLSPLQTCTFINYHFNGTGYFNTPYGADLPGVNNTALTTLPVRIIDGGASSDTLEVQYGYPASGVPGSDVTAVQVSYASPIQIRSAVGFARGDRIVTNAGGICTMAAVTNDDPVASPITHATTYSNAAVEPYNVGVAPGGTGWNTITDVTAAPTPYLANLGNFVSKRFAVGASGLTVAELPAFTANPLVDNVVFMKAEYGLAASGTATQVTSWAGGATVINNTSAARVVAVRIGLVARSPLIEKDAVDAPTTLTVLPAVTGGIATTYDVPDTRYRYRVYNTIIPLKNMLWTRCPGAAATC